MKLHIEQLLHQALAAVVREDGLDTGLLDTRIQVERTRDKAHGDFASNLAMVIAKPARVKPRDLAEKLRTHLPASPHLAGAEIAGPGFINFRLTTAALQSVVQLIHEQGEAFGRSMVGNGQRVQVEFVSANPTGPLHVGHGRGAAYGAVVADLLVAVGFHVHREYYVNDAGRQMNILATSVWLRYLERCGESLVFPSNAYRGDYVLEIAERLHNAVGDRLRHTSDQVFADAHADEGVAGGDKERHIDDLIARAQSLLGAEDYREVFDFGLKSILDDIRDDLEGFGVAYEEWFSERSLTDQGIVDDCVRRLQASGHVYNKDGALWFRSTDFGDEKDRVVQRENGQKTYFASDIAYHMNKLERGFERVIDVWGADHHGYVPRVRAALQALGEDVSKLDVLLVQFAILYRGGQKVQMSTRSGSFVTLRELREEVGNDAARFFYVMRKCEQHLDFDLDLAKSESSDNPVYYIQYAHARVSSVMRQLQEKSWSYDEAQGLASLSLLTESHETALLDSVSRYPEMVESAALNHEPHQLAHYLRELANLFHTYYNAHIFLADDDAMRNARLCLVLAVQRVLRNGLSLLGVSAPETM